MNNGTGIDMNKVNKVETPYGNGYYYGGRLYSEEDFNKMLQRNNSTVTPASTTGNQLSPSIDSSFRNGGGFMGLGDDKGKNNDSGKTTEQTAKTAGATAAPAAVTQNNQFTQEMYNRYKSEGRAVESAAILLQHPEFESGANSQSQSNTQQPAVSLTSLMSVPTAEAPLQGSTEVPEDMRTGVFYGEYGDVIVRNGRMAKGVSITPTPGNYQIHYDPIYEQALKGTSGEQNQNFQNTANQQGQPGANQNQQNTANPPASQNGSIPEPPAGAKIIQPNPKGQEFVGNNGKPQGQPSSNPGTKPKAQNPTPKVPAPTGLGIAPSMSNMKKLSSPEQLFRRWNNSSGGFEVVDSTGKVLRMASPSDAQTLKDVPSQRIQ